jgi:hypothetical protein
MVFDDPEEPTYIHVFGKYVHVHTTEQLEHTLVPYLEKLTEDFQLPPRYYPRHHVPFHRY